MSDASHLTCPQCSAPMDVKYMGRMKDKMLFCAHCGYKKDFPDEYEMRRREVEKTKHGSKTVEVSYRRKDMHGEFPSVAAKNDSSSRDNDREAWQVEERSSPGTAGANEKIMELTRKVAKGEIDPTELREQIAKLGLRPTEQGKSWGTRKGSENVYVTTWNSYQGDQNAAQEVMEKALGSLPEAFRDLASGKEHSFTHSVNEDKTFHFGGRDADRGEGITLRVSSSNALVLAMVVVVLLLGVILLLLL